MGDYLDCGAGAAGGVSTLASATLRSDITRKDRIRERELFRFYRPDDFNPEHDGQSPPSSPPQPYEVGEESPITNNDVTLAALAQLVALRLGVHRAMINVIGRETQYTLVESTKTLDLVNQTTAEIDGDEAWMCSGGSIHKSVSLCENVVVLPSEVLPHPFLIIPDLREDARFKDRPYVAGFPRYRFYAGTPLKTARGVAIGALCVFAHEPRGLTETEQVYMGTIAETIMQHLEMRRAAAERDKVTRMSRGLNAFVEGRSSQFVPTFDKNATRDALLQPVTPMESLPPTEGGRKNTAIALGDATTPTPNRGGASVEGSDSTLKEKDAEDRNGRPQAASSVSASETSKTMIEEQFSATLSRAAGLLDEALGLKEGGGVVFYDTVARMDLASSTPSTPLAPSDGSEVDDWSNFSDGAVTPGIYEGGREPDEARAPILSSSVSPHCNVGHPNESYRKLTSRMISKLIKWYPSGRTWEFDEQGIIPSNDDGVTWFDASSQQRAAEKEARKWAESQRLMSIFPGIRSLVFVPLWDANLSRHYAACFAWTTDAMARFSADVEFSFVTAFGNSISAEISRLATIDADQRKSDFIGSVSHELRSPLHGVLASAEFLADTKVDSFQSTLVSTIDSCGRTLLDTINHVLDYSKINSLRRTWKKNTKHHRTHSGSGSRDNKAMQSGGIMSILGTTDVAAITEEVVDSVYAGKMYAKAFSPADITDVDASGMSRRDSEQQRWQDPTKSGVQVFLDVAPGDYHFVTQPGAIRRIIMNIFGNALKYTDKGSIIVRLCQQTHPEDPSGKSRVILTVKDTGKGISQGYIRTRLFTPFAQENDLAPGTGLGLSIVRSIVTMLRGEISLRSKVGQGTEVRITLPNLARPTPRPNEAGEDVRSTLLDFTFLQAYGEQLSIGLWGFTSGRGNAYPELERILRRYLGDWCKIRNVFRLEEGTRAQVVIVDETNLKELEKSRMVGSKDNVVVLCKNPAPVQSSEGTSSQNYFLLKPFGPYKLARTIRKCIERSETTSEEQLGPKSATTPVAMPKSTRDEVDQKGVVAATEILRGSKANTANFLEPARPRLSSISIGVSPLGSVVTDGPIAPETNSIDRVLPVTPTTADSTQNISRDPLHAAENISRPSPRILVVDDNRTNLMLLQTFLKKRGISADSASDGGMAVERATATKYDIIFMDISMPVMNGFEATREIRRHEEMVRKQYKRESINLSRSRPTSKIWLQGSAAMTPSQSQQRHPHGIEQPAPFSPSREFETSPQNKSAPNEIPTKPVTPPISPEDESHHVISRRPESVIEASDSAAALADVDGLPPHVKSALIIALTGLASGRDQSEAFTSGVDLYMTKPVSFKEVGRLIENWIANGGLVKPKT